NGEGAHKSAPFWHSMSTNGSEFFTTKSVKGALCFSGTAHVLKDLSGNELHEWDSDIGLIRFAMSSDEVYGRVSGDPETIVIYSLSGNVKRSINVGADVLWLAADDGEIFALTGN